MEAVKRHSQRVEHEMALILQLMVYMAMHALDMQWYQNDYLCHDLPSSAKLL